MKWRCLELRIVYARADLKSFGNIWTYCHLSICFNFLKICSGVGFGMFAVIMGESFVIGAVGQSWGAWRTLGHWGTLGPLGNPRALGQS
jgi:hypothetical protein